MLKFVGILSLYHGSTEDEFSLCASSCVNSFKYLTENLNPKTSLFEFRFLLLEDGPINFAACKIFSSIVEQYQVKVECEQFQLAENIGLGASLRECVKDIRADVIIRIDVDDIIATPHFFNVVKKFSADSDVSVISSAILEFKTEVTDSENKVRLLGVRLPNDNLLFAFIKTPLNHVGSALRVTDLIEVGNYRNIAIEDWDLWLRFMLKQKKIIVSKEIGAFVKAGDGQIARRVGIGYILKELEFFFTNIWSTPLAYLPVLFASSILRIFIRALPSSVVQLFMQAFLRETDQHELKRLLMNDTEVSKILLKDKTLVR